VLAVLGGADRSALRAALGPGAAGAGAAGAHLADVAEVGTNPGRIIAAWRELVDRHPPGTAVRGVSELGHASRTAEEMVECHHHEGLLNLAFAGTGPFWLLCPYDERTLGQDDLFEAERNHPVTHHCGGVGASPSRRFAGLEALARPFDAPLSPVPAHARGLVVEVGVPGGLARARRVLAGLAEEAGLPTAAAVDLLTATNEVLTNSLRHGGGRGELLVWSTGDALICQVGDRGRLTDPLVGRQPAPSGATGGRGMWMANQLCDLLQIRSLPEGTVVRLHMRLRS
jgi:anti-sigma regulatory factor (Ser/Thr protein kinase)